MQTNTRKLFTAAFAALALTGCVGSAPNEPPSDLSDGTHTHTFTQIASNLCRYNCVDMSSTYTGQWEKSIPKGLGEVIGNHGLTCRGEFGIQPPLNPAFPNQMQRDTSTLLSEGGEKKLAEDHYVWAKGEVFDGGKLFYTGIFRNNFYFGESCMPLGEGTFKSALSGALIKGNYKLSLNRRRNVYNAFLAVGPCTIKRKDGASYEGKCDSPTAEDGVIWLQGMKDLLSRDAFFLATSSGAFTEPDGRHLSKREGEQKVAQYKQYISDRDQAAALAENNRKIAQAEADTQAEHQSDGVFNTNTLMGIAAIAGATAGNYNAQLAMRSMQAAAPAVPLAQLRPANTTSSEKTAAAPHPEIAANVAGIGKLNGLAGQALQSPVGNTKSAASTASVAAGATDRIYFAYALQYPDRSVPRCSTEGPTGTHGPLAKIAPLPDPPGGMSWDLLAQNVTETQCNEWLNRCLAKAAGSLCH